MVKKVNAYEAFIEGAKEGFHIAVGIIPYLVAMLVAIGVFRASGGLEAVMDGVRWLVQWFGLDTRFVDGLPTALMKPLSGSGSRAMMIETMKAPAPTPSPDAWLPSSRAAPKPLSTCWRCTSVRSASSACATP